MPILLVGPHGYGYVNFFHRSIISKLIPNFFFSASPIELFFSMLKNSNLNEERLPLGKKDFSNVVEIVLRQVQQMERRDLILLFHHCLQKAFEYVVFKRL